MDTDEETWRIGELAAATGLTVRTLHYYDRIGMLSPSLRNRGGQRRYTEGDARVLYQIVALRGLGLQLQEIQECLRAIVDPRPLIAKQLRALQANLAAGERLRQRLQSLSEDLDHHDQPTTQDLLDLIQQTTEVETLVTAYITPEQMDRLSRRDDELTEDVARKLRSELPRLYQKALVELDAGTDPESEVVRDIAAQIDEVSAVLSGGDPSITAGVRRMWAQRGDDVYPGSGVPWAGLVDYLDRARGAATTAS